MRIRDRTLWSSDRRGRCDHVAWPVSGGSGRPGREVVRGLGDRAGTGEELGTNRPGPAASSGPECPAPGPGPDGRGRAGSTDGLGPPAGNAGCGAATWPIVLAGGLVSCRATLRSKELHCAGELAADSCRACAPERGGFRRLRVSLAQLRFLQGVRANTHILAVVRLSARGVDRPAWARAVQSALKDPTLDLTVSVGSASQPSLHAVSLATPPGEPQAVAAARGRTAAWVGEFVGGRVAAVVCARRVQPDMWTGRRAPGTAPTRPPAPAISSWSTPAATAWSRSAPTTGR